MAIFKSQQSFGKRVYHCSVLLKILETLKSLDKKTALSIYL
jgi:hypothetical protein